MTHLERQDYEMNQDFLTQDCNRQDELLSVLYGEASAEDARQFQTHLRQCASCKEQYEAFSGVRSSVRELRDQALVGFQSPPVSRKVEQKSARAALKAFFDLSPGWMKFGTAFATAALCIFGFLAFRKTEPSVPHSAVDPAKVGTKVYSEQELKDAVAKAASTVEERDYIEVKPSTEEPVDRFRVNRNPPPSTKSRRPLSRNERQQLASDLRLVTRPDDDGLQLLSDRINQ